MKLSTGRIFVSLLASSSLLLPESSITVTAQENAPPEPPPLCESGLSDSTILGCDLCPCCDDPTDVPPQPPLATACPEGAGDKLRLDDVPVNRPLTIATTNASQLCALWLRSSGSNSIRDKPVARSYQGNDWEAYAGELAAELQVACEPAGEQNETTVCTLDLSQGFDIAALLNGGYTFELTTSEHAISETHAGARFLEQATFGPTRESLQTLLEGFASVGQWVKEQQDVIPASLHRAFFRERINHRYTGGYPVGLATHPCDAGTRYRRYSFVAQDRDAILTLISFNFTEDDNGSGNVTTKKAFLLQDQVRTVVNVSTIFLDRPSEGVIMEDGEYIICTQTILPKVGGEFRVRASESGGCITPYLLMDDDEEVPLGNPPVYVEEAVDAALREFFRNTTNETICEEVFLNETAFNNETNETVFNETNVTICMEVMVNGTIENETMRVVLDLTNHVTEFDNQYYPNDTLPQELRVLSAIDDTDLCASLPPFTGIPPEGEEEQLVFGLYNGEYWLHDPRYDLLSNTLAAPVSNGGGDRVVATKAATKDEAKQVLCSSAPRSFINEDMCQISTESDSCSYDLVGFKGNIPVELTFENLRLMYEGTDRLIYAVNGLSQEGTPPYASPCTAGAFSRWAPADDCTNDATVGATTIVSVAQLIREAALTSSNPFLLDIRFPSNGALTCDANDQNRYDFKVDVDGQCWENVHRDYYEVYDFTAWLTEYPLGPDALSAFAKNGTFVYTFPSDVLSMAQWYGSVAPDSTEFRELWGTLGSAASVRAGNDIIESLGLGTIYPDLQTATVVCGSPGEVDNNGDLGGSAARGGFDILKAFENEFDAATPRATLYRQRLSVWMEIALKRPDQLRQRMAFALSHILAIVPNDIDTGTLTEPFLAYYDILVRHAFDNYRDMLKEVSFSPLMGEMLTFLGSRSTEYIWNTKRRLEFADENYAREIMQLFTIGLYKLNNDGTPILDETGKKILTYTNADVIEYARHWTGFERVDIRGNIEVDQTSNKVDAMEIVNEYRDRYPKRGLDGWYIGDGLPLCADLPSRPFLRKGAMYRLMGSFNKPYYLTEPPEWATNQINITRFGVESGSALYDLLCAEESSACTYPATVVLDADLTCTGSECDIDDVRVVEVGSSGIFYEHFRIPCAQQAFYEGGTMMRSQSSEYFCADPRLMAGSVACCGLGSVEDAVSTNELYPGERVSRDTASQRCTDNSLSLCERPSFTCDACDYIVGYWSAQSCALQAKVDQDGYVAIVHIMDDPQVADNNLINGVGQDVKTFFRVDWTNNDDAVKFVNESETQCELQGCGRDTADNFCLCPVDVVEELMFDNAPTREDVLKLLYFGAFNPDDHFFTGQETDLGGGVTMYSTTGSFTSESIFKVVDDNGITQFRKNLQSTVVVGTGPLSLSFRNPTHMISITTPDLRDAHHETDAALDHYIFHNNTAPFVAIRIAQRFGISNPSLRFVDTVANAFRSGQYVDPDSGISFGDGRYGSLGAMIAAVLLDREARSVILDVDPAHGSALEPYLRFLRYMKVLEYRSDVDFPFIEFDGNMMDILGQQPHELPTVFSFFLPEYSPPGSFAQKDLVCPECASHTMAKSIAITNGILSLAKYGFTDSFGGLGLGRRGGWSNGAEVGDFTTAEGHLTWEPQDASTASDIVNDLNTYLTAGRLSDLKITQLTQVYQDAITEGRSPQQAMIRVQQLFALVPEFHANAISNNAGDATPPDNPATPSPEPYKAFIFVMLDGGADTYNLIVPRVCVGKNPAGTTVDQQYRDIRGDLAFTQEQLDNLTISTTVDGDLQPCSRWAIHEEMPLLKELYDDDDLIFFMNAGVIQDGTSTKRTLRVKTDVQLFAHNSMQQETRKIDPDTTRVGTGVGGRLAAVLTSKGYKTGNIAIDDPSVAVVPPFTEAPEALVVNRNGVETFNPKPESEAFNATPHAFELNADPSSDTSLFGEYWSDKFTTSIIQARDLSAALKNTTLGDHWPRNEFSGRIQLGRMGQQFAMIARLMQTKDVRGTDRDFYYATGRGFDNHANLKDRLKDRFQEVNEGLTALVTELKRLGMWNDVALVVFSEFGRTLTPNGGSGSDHAYAGNYFLMGGGVKGGKILGKYPADLTTAGPVNLGRGRLLPTTSLESIWYGVAQHMGAETEEELAAVLPNGVKATTGDAVSNFFTEEDLFETSSRRRTFRRMRRIRKN